MSKGMGMVPATVAAKRLGVSRVKIWLMIKNKEIPTYPDPLDRRKKLIDESDINALLASRESRGEREKAA